MYFLRLFKCEKYKKETKNKDNCQKYSDDIFNVKNQKKQAEHNLNLNLMHVNHDDVFTF